jgi:hypothetical protein
MPSNTILLTALQLICLFAQYLTSVRKNGCRFLSRVDEKCRSLGSNSVNGKPQELGPALEALADGESQWSHSLAQASALGAKVVRLVCPC